jgi:hypothetical protein
MLTWAEVLDEAAALAERWRGAELRGVYGVPAGGAPVALMVSAQLGLPVADAPGDGVLVVDDVVETGRTLRRYGHPADALYRKPLAPSDLAPGAAERAGWLAFPWEHAGPPTDGLVRMLEFLAPELAQDEELIGLVLRRLTEDTGARAQFLAVVTGL